MYFAFSVGVGVFLPHGENIAGDVLIEVNVSTETTKHKETVEVTRKEILKHSEMCIDHATGARLPGKETVECYPAPGNIYDHRKHKRHCMGLHPLPVMLGDNVEVEQGDMVCVTDLQ